MNFWVSQPEAQGMRQVQGHSGFSTHLTPSWLAPKRVKRVGETEPPEPPTWGVTLEKTRTGLRPGAGAGPRTMQTRPSGAARRRPRDEMSQAAAFPHPSALRARRARPVQRPGTPAVPGCPATFCEGPKMPCASSCEISAPPLPPTCDGAKCRTTGGQQDKAGGPGCPTSSLGRLHFKCALKMRAPACEIRLSSRPTRRAPPAVPAAPRSLCEPPRHHPTPALKGGWERVRRGGGGSVSPHRSGRV